MSTPRATLTVPIDTHARLLRLGPQQAGELSDRFGPLRSRKPLKTEFNRHLSSKYIAKSITCPLPPKSCPRYVLDATRFSQNVPTISSNVSAR
jgi:hypothetical protein